MSETDERAEQARAAEYAGFVAAMPLRYETDLMADHVSTAYWMARSRGWTQDVIIHDCEGALGKGGEVGLVVHRLRAMSQTAPVTRDRAPEPWRPPSSTGVCLDAAKISERVELLQMIRDVASAGSAISSEDAGSMMQQLIDEQASVSLAKQEG